MQGSERTTVGLVALLLGLFGFGWIGIHKFMLGYTSEGIIMLVVSIATCGIGAAVFTIISIVEGVIYLTKSDQQFYREYVAQKRAWF